jgi:hypothetical protein
MPVKQVRHCHVFDTRIGDDQQYRVIVEKQPGHAAKCVWISPWRDLSERALKRLAVRLIRALNAPGISIDDLDKVQVEWGTKDIYAHCKDFEHGKIVD